VLGGLWTIIPEQEANLVPQGSKAGVEHLRQDLSRTDKISNKTAVHQPLRLDSKPRAWGTMDRHNISKGLKAL